ncbi:dihydroxy-acid dehydratase [Candidatus Symbiopectobacterium sp. 'North America']|uniref:dihydroxy-acid dehydratase n=1 Tax=Candidatus Symbiopectobacterium sp. 'North America' TaxID=2794574 RepID=UPI0018C9F693|nr:dihydroxy-acid dehydratase [Candidatus Symbiopectobacterium sp. 'North America']MBG6246272.1 dihydroxy-acid dehydratase [Candidatus Symbiopectobacterium sp. 'North America']
MRSQKILGSLEWGFNRSVFKSIGYSDEDLKRPVIGIANSWNELVPGHFNLRQVGESVKKGIHMAGGTAVEFGLIAACDGTAQGHKGMHYILPSRDMIANDIEIMVEAYQLDAIVMLGSCDKIVPAMLMAAAHLNIPAIILPGGPMLGGEVFDGRKSDLTTMSESLGMLKAGKITEDVCHRLENTCGSCSFLGTANTMCSLSEAIGMTLPNGALMPAVYSERLRLGESTGFAIMNMVKNNVTARDIITIDAIKNAIRVLMAIGGSTNAVLHLSALAHELDISAETMMDLYEELSDSTPQIVKVNPEAKFDMEDFHRAGGIPQVMHEISGLLEKGALTVTGQTVGENLAAMNLLYQPNRDIIKPLETPFAPQGGIAILKGNIAPKSGVTKPAAILPEMHHFTGKAVCFDSEDAAEEAILAGQIKPGDVLVIRYEGPKGGPGMREMFKAMKYLYGMGLTSNTAIITDGRFSGTNNGCFVGHISPEVAEGGPIAALRDGDVITIDIPNKTIHAHLTDEEIAQRLQQWHAPKRKFTKGTLGIYSQLASSAHESAVLK